MSARKRPSRRTPRTPEEETPRTACEWLHNFGGTITIAGRPTGGLAATLRVRHGEVDVVLSQAVESTRIAESTYCELVSIARRAIDAVPFPF
jgi:hypothetical protein